MVFFFTRYTEGEDHGWLFFDRPHHLHRKQYVQLPMDRVTFLSHEGSWFGAFLFETDGGGTRHLRQSYLFFGTGAQVWARVRRQFYSYAPSYYIKPLKMINDEHVIQLVECRTCKGKGKLEENIYTDSERDCDACVGTAVEEFDPRTVQAEPEIPVTWIRPDGDRLLAEYDHILLDD